MDQAKTDTLTMVDLDGMGSPGITDDVEKFELLLRKLAAERYATAFKQRWGGVVWGGGCGLEP